MKAAIIAYGENMDSREIMKAIENCDYVICADGGGETAYRFGITPDYLIGDFDSLKPQILEYFKESSAQIIYYPREKDYTDTEICVYKALEIGCMDICIVSGIGSRIDHSLGNIGLLHLISQRGGRGSIISKDCSIYLCRDYIELEGNTGDIISIIPFNGDTKGIRSRGLKYTLSNTDIEFGKPIGISNEMINDKCSIEVEKGELLVIKQKNS